MRATIAPQSAAGRTRSASLRPGAHGGIRMRPPAIRPLGQRARQVDHDRRRCRTRAAPARSAHASAPWASTARDQVARRLSGEARGAAAAAMSRDHRTDAPSRSPHDRIRAADAPTLAAVGDARPAARRDPRGSSSRTTTKTPRPSPLRDVEARRAARARRGTATPSTASAAERTVGVEPRGARTRRWSTRCRRASGRRSTARPRRAPLGEQRLEGRGARPRRTARRTPTLGLTTATMSATASMQRSAN